MSDILELCETPPAAVLARPRALSYWELAKPRIAGMVLVVTALGFYLALSAGEGGAMLPLLAHTLLGTALVAAGANALNQYLEADLDAMMTRTVDRPLPSGRLTGSEVVAFATVLGVTGVVYLALTVNVLASLLAASALLSYAFVYTPLKRKTALCVFVGAVPGALPPVIGWAAAAGSLSPGSLLLFAVLFFWQLPHFASIAWLYRDDYRRAGFPMMSVVDPGGRRTSVHTITQTIALLVVSLLPVLCGLAGAAYAVGAVVLGLAFLGVGGLFVARRTNEGARLHLLVSVAYLPLLFVLMMVDKVSMP